uniref:dUTPase-like domain-containing protein n=1 Tax=Timema douglasi TaxID=61478 RepID=A0A7R8VGB3_TIMDO|nr:unnamed protein product [Timema douglasi]
MQVEFLWQWPHALQHPGSFSYSCHNVTHNISSVEGYEGTLYIFKLVGVYNGARSGGSDMKPSSDVLKVSDSINAMLLEDWAGTYGRISPRSSLALHHGIDVLAGVIDEDYHGLGIHHLNNGHLITRDMFNKGYFMLAFDLTPDSAGQDSHTCLQSEGNTDLDIAITCLFYSEYEGTVLIDSNWETMDVQKKMTPSDSVRCVRPLLLSVCCCQSRRLEPEAIHRPVLNHQLVQERPTGHHAVQTSIFQLSKTTTTPRLVLMVTTVNYRSPVQTQTAMEKVTCIINMVEDHLPSEDSQLSLVTRTF